MKWIRKRGDKSRRKDETRADTIGEQRDQNIERKEIDENTTDALDYHLINEENNTQSRARHHWAVLRNAVFRKAYTRPTPQNDQPKTLKDAEKAMERPFYLVLTPMVLVLMAYIVVGVIVYCRGEGWPIRDALYFIVVTLLTIGYGDLSPSTAGMKAFTMLFASTGVGLLGAILGIVGQVFVKMQMERWESIQGEHSDKVLEQFDVEEDDTATDSPQQHEKQSCMKRLRESTFLVPAVHVFLILTVGTTVLSLAENWSPMDALYWTFITTTTIGYGDHVPETGATRWFSIFFLPMAVVVISEVLGKIARAFVEKDMAKAEKDLFNSKVTVDDLIAMDIDGDGHVTKLEYFEFMLKAMNKVDQEVLDKLHAQFTRLDADGSGTLEMSDLELLTRRERGMDRSKRALEMSVYKSQLLQASSEPGRMV